MTYAEIKAHFAAIGRFPHAPGAPRLMIPCPDGIERLIWGIQPETGAVFVSEWNGDAWMDCSHPDGQFRVEFD